MNKWFDLPHKFGGSTWIGASPVDYYAACIGKDSDNNPIFAVVEVWNNNRDNYKTYGRFATLDEAYDEAYWTAERRNNN